MHEHQQTLEEIEEGIMGALRAQAADFSSLVGSAQMVANHFSARIPPMLRHIPLEHTQTPYGWVTGANGIRSYFDMCRIYWKWTVYVQADGVSVDPVERSVSFIVDTHWEWLDPSRGLPWIETASSKQTYDSDFKMTIAEYITLSGGNTNALMVGDLNRQLFDEPIAKSGRSMVCVS